VARLAAWRLLERAKPMEHDRLSYKARLATVTTVQREGGSGPTSRPQTSLPSS